MMMMMIAFITFKSSLVPLFEGLWSSNSLQSCGFRVHHKEIKGRIWIPSLSPVIYKRRKKEREIWLSGCSPLTCAFHLIKFIPETHMFFPYFKGNSIVSTGLILTFANQCLLKKIENWSTMNFERSWNKSFGHQCMGRCVCYTGVVFAQTSTKGFILFWTWQKSIFDPRTVTTITLYLLWKNKRRKKDKKKGKTLKSRAWSHEHCTIVWIQLQNNRWCMMMLMSAYSQ